MAKKRRQDGKSAEAAAAAFAAVAAGSLAPPATVRLRAGDLPIWDAIVRARAREEWSETDLQHAANLTRCMADIERISSELSDEGDVMSNDRGTRYVNPKHSLLETLSRRSVALTRLLHLHASVLVDARRTLAVRDNEAAAREAMKQPDDDGLLAKPVLQ